MVTKRKDLIKRDYDMFNRGYNTKKIAVLRKLAALGWQQDGTNITNRFADLDNERLRHSMIIAGATAAGGGAVDAMLGHGSGQVLTSGKQLGVEELTDFDPETGAYIGKSYAIPHAEKDMQKLHQRITGAPWRVSAPKWLEWLLAERKERIRQSIIATLKAGKGNTKGMSNGEIASLVFPNVYKNDGTVARNLGVWRWRDFPVKGIFKARPISMTDIQEYEKTKKQEKSLQKTADYSDFLTHDFYDKLTPSGDDDFERYTAYYKGLDKLFGKILKGKHGLAYMGRGSNETGATTGLYVRPLFGNKALSYSAWKGQVEQALKSKALDDLESLTYPTEFHVTTASPESTYGDIFEDSPSDEYVKSIYGASPKLRRILALAAKHRQLSQAKQNVLDALYDAEEPFDAEYDKLEEEEQKVLQDIDARTDAAWNKWFDAEEAKKDKDIVAQLRKKYEALAAEYDKQKQPFIDRGDAIANRQYKVVKPYHKQLDTLENRISKLYGERL